MLSSFECEFNSAMATLSDEEMSTEVDVSVATGAAAYDFMCRLVEKLKSVCYNVHCTVYQVENRFFGGEITVTGLLTGRDLSEQLAGQHLGDRLLLSRNMLRQEGDLFLCGMTPAELEEKLGVPLVFTENDGADFLYNILGI